MIRYYSPRYQREKEEELPMIHRTKDGKLLVDVGIMGFA